MARRCDEEAAHQKLPATIYDGHGGVLFPVRCAFNERLANLLVRHLCGHLKQIQARSVGQA
ncbi:MAG TPA: hypothetical protein VGW37_04900 [Terriglobia bacterium]|nr:hypothetical protein [Terriglobia bacterium]